MDRVLNVEMSFFNISKGDAVLSTHGSQTSAASGRSASFSQQVSWLRMAGHMAADSSCVLHFMASILKRDFLSISVQKILGKDFDWPILAQDQCSKGCKVI